MTRAATAVVLGLAVAHLGCGGGGRPLRPLRITIAESGGHFELATTEPIRAIACVVRDHRRSPGDPAAVRLVWAAHCDADCPRSVRYGDQMLTPDTRPERLVPSEQGTCYECVLDGTGTRGRVAFGVTPTGNFEPCRGRVGDL